MIRSARLAVLASALSASCGYRVGGLYADYPSVRVELFDTASERRTHEFDLTQAVLRELSSRGVRVNRPEAPFTLRGRLLDIRTPPRVEGQADVVLVGSLLFRLEIMLLNAGGDVLWKDERVETVSFTSARGESFESARQEIFHHLARWVATHFEKEW